MNILSAGVMQGLIGASSHVKTAEVSMEVYDNAKNRNDDSTMKRALGYATDSLNSAAESSKEAGEALKEAQIEAKKQAKAEREAALEEKRRQKATEAKAEGQTRNEYSTADTIEISEEGRASLNLEPHAEVDVPIASAEKVVAEPKIYTPHGEMKVAAHEPNVTIRV